MMLRRLTAWLTWKRDHREAATIRARAFAAHRAAVERGDTREIYRTRNTLKAATTYLLNVELGRSEPLRATAEQQRRSALAGSPR